MTASPAAEASHQIRPVVRLQLRALVLADPADDLALAVAASWRGRHGNAALKMVPLEMLLFAPRWEHRVGVAGSGSSVVLHDGTDLADFAPGVVLNRLAGWPSGFAARWSNADRAYAQSEMFALVLSWLAAMGDSVINRPVPPSLAGPHLSPIEWTVRARLAGLVPLDATVTSSARRVTPYGDRRDRSDLLDPGWLVTPSSALDRPAAWSPAIVEQRDVLVIDGTAHDAPLGLAASCVRLAHACAADVLAISLARPRDTPFEWRFVNADAMPCDVDAEQLAAIVAAMEQRASRI